MDGSGHPDRPPDAPHPPTPRVLIIDDDAAFRYLLRRFLGGLACSVAEAEDGEEGLCRARAERPAAILLDLNMPRLDGFAVLERLKADPTTRAIPVVVVTARVLGAAEQERLRAAAGDVLAKETLHADGLVTKVRELLGARSTP